MEIKWPSRSEIMDGITLSAKGQVMPEALIPSITLSAKGQVMPEALIPSITLSAKGQVMPEALIPSITLSPKEQVMPEALIPSITAPGVIAGVWLNDKLVYKIEYGLSDISTAKPMDWSTKVPIGSITKTYTCAIILMLAEQNLLDIDDDANKYLSWIPSGIKIKHLGNMTSGLYNYTEDDNFNKKLDDDPYKNWTPDELVAISQKNPLNFNPGESWEYSNTNTVILALIAETITNKSIEQLYREFIFEPLKLNSTYASNDSDNPAIPNCNGYMYGYFSPDDEEKSNELRDVTLHNRSYSWAAGHIISDIEDLKTWIKMFVGGKIFDDTTIQTRNNTFISQPRFDYGFGLMSTLDKNWFGHNGQICGYQSIAMHSPKYRATIVVMTNLYAEQSGEKPADNIFKRLSKFVEN